MKTKTILSIITFLTTFSICLMLVTLSSNDFVSRLFKKEINPQTQAKIYNFLRQDLQIQREMSEKLNQVEQSENILIIKTYYEMREKMDVSDLPEDFRCAWEKKILSDVEWVGFMNHLRAFNKKGTIETEAEKEITDKKIAESKELDYEFQTVAQSYGIEFDAYGNLIEKN